jgi:transposase
MPRPKPAHLPHFSNEDLALARRIAAAHSAPVREVRRAKIALALCAQPEFSHGEIAALCQVDRETVYKWRRRWAEHGFSLTDAPRSGRPRSFSP